MRMSIAYALDASYIKPFLAQLIALYERANAETIYDLYILNYKLAKTYKQRISNCVKQLKAEAQVNFLDISDEQYAQVPSIGPWGKETNYRGLLPGLLPEIDKILYLDADTFVLTDLTHLLNLDLTNCLFAAAADYFELPRTVVALASYEKNLAIQPVIKDYGYVNAGVLLMNLAYWRAHNIESEFLRLLNLLHEKKIKTLPDQDVLNYLAIKDGISRIYHLPSTYNTMTTMKTTDVNDRKVDMAKHYLVDEVTARIRRHVRDSYVKNRADDLLYDEMAIIHFVGYKPWATYRQGDALVPLFKPYADRVGLKIPSLKRRYIPSLYALKKKASQHKKALILLLSLNSIALIIIAYLMALWF